MVTPDKVKTQALPTKLTIDSSSSSTTVSPSSNTIPKIESSSKSGIWEKITLRKFNEKWAAPTTLKAEAVGANSLNQDKYLKTFSAASRRVISFTTWFVLDWIVWEGLEVAVASSSISSETTGGAEEATLLMFCNCWV